MIFVEIEEKRWHGHLVRRGYNTIVTREQQINKEEKSIITNQELQEYLHVLAISRAGFT